MAAAYGFPADTRERHWRYRQCRDRVRLMPAFYRAIGRHACGNIANWNWIVTFGSARPVIASFFFAAQKFLDRPHHFIGTVRFCKKENFLRPPFLGQGKTRSCKLPAASDSGVSPCRPASTVYFYCVINAIGLQVVGRRLTAWTSREGFCERDGEAFSDRRDRVFDVAFGTDRRRLGVNNRRVGEASCAAGRLRGELRPVPSQNP